MSKVQPTPICPSCGKEVDPSARACRACGQELDRDPSPDAAIADRPRPKRRGDDDEDYEEFIRRRPRNIQHDPSAEALDWIVPHRESLWAIAAGYCGLFACFPLVGLLAIALGVIALKDIKRNKGRRGTFRAWFGIVLGSLMSLVWGLLFVLTFISYLNSH
jgi:hypothetical protein